MKLLNNKRDVIACYRPFCQNKASPLFYHKHTRQGKPDPRTGTFRCKKRNKYIAGYIGRNGRTVVAHTKSLIPTDIQTSGPRFCSILHDIHQDLP